ncbi:MAG: DUF1566 domain-containing protein, partial [Dysgonamonadaceae bacterium]|nr:DUF1566 domain-containing protein [Dysgonamonadaceae bacterium]
TRIITLKAKTAAESITGAIKVNAENNCGASADYSNTTALRILDCSEVPAVPTGITFSKTEGIWLGEEITATATPEVTTGDSKPTKYNWTIPANFDITAGSGTRVITLKAKSAAESITGAIKVNAENDCGASAYYSNTTALSIFDCSSIPDQPGTISGNINVTSGTIQTYEVPAVPGVRYTWSLPNGWSGSSTTNSITVTAGSSGGTISVTPVNSCGSGTARTLSVATCPGAVITNGAYSGPATSNFGSAATTMAQLTGTYGFAVSGDLCLAVKDQGSPSTYTWTNANTQCSNLNTGDQTGWRLPNIAELGNLQSTRKDYGMNQNYYWSSTGRATSTYMWRWRYNTSNAYFYDRAVLNYVRCVKSL